MNDIVYYKVTNPIEKEKNLGKRYWKCRGVGVLVLNGMVRAGLPEKMTFEQRLEGDEKLVI